ncbi:LysE family translocator [Bosea sp. (in: a-proteobacteria)]|jgi:threonine/homoserine/homoserine lactone efflux protein|uniref:LysE family translocator n=1 Tax=Bosea sp. (in: a-proteobacteria) TaxID=1871050 RepID=UPI003F72F556
MTLASFLAFIGVALLVLVTPGPDTALTIRNTLFGGRRGGVLTALGVAVGQMVWALATSLGLVALLVASEPIFRAIQYAGAAYLIYLGVQALREAFRRQAPALPTAENASPARRLGPAAAFRQGLVSNLGNPKMAVFFGSLLPQFATGGAENFAALFLLGLVFVAMTFIWLSAYALVVAKAGDVLRRSQIRRVIEALTGGLLLALGLRIAAEQR